MDQRLTRLLDFFRPLPAVAVAYSGGVDSSLVLWAAATALGGRALGVTVRSEFVCAAERDRAVAVAKVLAASVGARTLALDVQVLPDERLRANPPERCYLCKRLVMAAVRDAAREALGPDAAVVEGTNADDDPARPGRRAVAEAGVLSPLAACGIDKAGVRELARSLDLPNADDPSNSCLATRVPTGAELTYARLCAVEGMERTARELGLSDLRARVAPGPEGDAVRLLVRPAQLLVARAQERTLRERAEFLGFTHFSLGERE